MSDVLLLIERADSLGPPGPSAEQIAAIQEAVQSFREAIEDWAKTIVEVLTPIMREVARIMRGLWLYIRRVQLYVWLLRKSRCYRLMAWIAWNLPECMLLRLPLWGFAPPRMCIREALGKAIMI